GILGRCTFELPTAVVGMVGLVTVTQALVTLTAQLSKALLDHFGEDVQAFTSAVGSLASLTGGTATAFVVFLLALISVLAGIVLVAAVVVCASLIHILAPIAPPTFPRQPWPALRCAGRRPLSLPVA